MHIPDGLLDPSVSAAAIVGSGATVAYAIRRVRRDLPERAAPLMGVTAACLFAAQTLNIPLLVAPASGHLLGGVLAAVLLGPWGGIVALTAVLVVQCFLFQDGGLTALGANVFLLGVIGSGLGYAIFATVRRRLRGPGGVAAAAAIAAWFSVQVSAATASVMIAVGPNFALTQIFGVMMLAHGVIGFGEAAITGLALSFVLRTRPDLLYGSDRPPGWRVGAAQVTLAGLGVAVALAAMAAPLASRLPDGLERTLIAAGYEPSGAVRWSPFAEYEMAGLEHLVVAGSLVGILGVIGVFAFAYGLMRAARAVHSPAAHTSDAG